MPGPPPKPPHLRQRTNKKAGIATISAPIAPKVPPIPNPDGREWHALTVRAWRNAWHSPMSTQWLETDTDALGRLALMWDEFYREPKALTLAEIRLQEQRFGLSPLDRSRLQWEVARSTEAEEKAAQRAAGQFRKRTGTDPRAFLVVP